MKRLVFCVTLALLILGMNTSAGAALTGVSDPSFESDTWDDGWFERGPYTGLQSDTDPAYPETPYGEMWMQFGNQSWMFQQIGTWEADMSLDIRMLSGKVAGKSYGGLKISLFAGGDASLASDAGDNDVPPDNLVNVVGATMIAESQQFDYPNGDDMGTFEVNVSLNTGSTGTEGDPLWLLVQSQGRQKVLVDNVAVTPEPATISLLAAGLFGITRRRRKA
ncbi:PEP-CTERM protein-sorting domain-containing protein [Anaerohalosphaera lusitana]|uniref:PEP-CTERM protein-sorting domain-containing protein n=2 Tax=Anaerohalosphaera lusitana TaxID=1936003 RepID=A0A1U9NM61_9BACT|nr:PEP-CTERM protein-sorting domain-containing protein [Anaerohalosphaera lusitana]